MRRIGPARSLALLPWKYRRQGVRRCTRLAAHAAWRASIQRGAACPKRHGAGLPADDPNWVDAAAAQAAGDPASRRIDVEIARDFLGIPGKPQHYVIFIIPPQQ